MLTRREFALTGLGLAAGATIVPLLDACGFASGGTSTAPSGSRGSRGIASASLQIAWWGGSDRAKRTQQVMDLFKQKHPGWTLSGQFSAFTPYWDKLSTQAAAGALPDVLQMDMAYIGRFAGRGQLLDLGRFRTNPLGLADFDPNQLQQGTVGGKLVGVSLGGNIDATMYNRSAIQRAGMSPPAEDVTWEGFATYLGILARKLPAGMYPCSDPSGSIAPFEVFVRQRRPELWTRDGKLAFKSGDVKDWFQYWSDLRRAKLIIPGDVAAAEAQNGTPAGSSIATGKAVFESTWSNFVGQYQVLMTDQVGMMRDPAGGRGSRVGDYVKASQLFSIPTSSKSPDAAAEFIAFFLHDAAAVKVLAVERGVPGVARTRSTIAPGLHPYDEAQVAFFNAFSGHTRAKAVLDPPGAGDVQTALTQASQSIALSGVSVADATSKFMQDAEKALSA